MAPKEPDLKALKTDLLLRALGLKHKIKVHDSMPQPDTHEEIARVTMSRWDLEDELKAIEQMLEDARQKSVAAKAAEIKKVGVHLKKQK